MKKYLFGLFAIALAVGFASFTTKSRTTTSSLWVFETGDPTSPIDTKDQDNYRAFTGEDELCEGSLDAVCVIQAEEDVLNNPGKPLIEDQDIEDYIDNALQGGTPVQVDKKFE